MSKVKIVILLLQLIAFTTAQPLIACTIIAAGKNTTMDGSVILAANNDWPGYPGHLKHVNRKVPKPGDKYEFASGFCIPQVSETYAYNYVSSAYATGKKNESWLYGINENQVAVVMAGTYNYKELPTFDCHMEPDDLPWLILERAASAQEALDIITSMIDQYGFCGGGFVDVYSSATIAIADKNEVWIFEPIPGGIWVAARVPDDMVAFRTNNIGTHYVDLNDHKNFRYSGNMLSVAIENKWYLKGEPFDYEQTFCYPASESYGFHESDTINALRSWRMARLFSGKTFDIDKPVYAVVPEEKLSVQYFMNVLRDYLQGTPYDPSKMKEAGLYGNPFHEAWGNTLSRSGTCVSVIIQLRNHLPDIIGGVMWVGFDNPATSVYTPWYLGINETPVEFQIGEALQYDHNSAWWNFQEVGNLCYRRFNEAALNEVIPLWKSFEETQFAEVLDIENEALKLLNEKGVEAACLYLNAYSNRQGIKALTQASTLKDKLRAKFLDNTVITK